MRLRLSLVSLLALSLTWISLSAHGSKKSIPPPPSLPPNTIQNAKKAGLTDPSAIQFWRAITNTSTARSYVVITVFNKITQTTNTFCTEAPFLLGAIHIEHKIEYDQYGIAKAIELAMALRQKPFEFENPKALENIEIQYSDADLQWAVNKISRFSNKQIIAAFNSRTPSMFELDLYVKIPQTKGNLQRAIAHALYNRGLCVGSGCRAGNLWVNS